MRRVHLCDCSRASLEAMEASVARDVAGGRLDLAPWLAQIRAHKPDAPPYDIDHRAREDRRT